MALDKKGPSSRRALQGKKVPISTYLDVGLFDDLVALAARNERPVAAEIRLAVRSHIEKAAA